VAARFFVDENDLALGKALAHLRADVVFPGHHDLPEVVRGMADDEWLPTVGARQLVVITRDRRIRYRAVEKRIVGDASRPGLRAHRPAEPVDHGQLGHPHPVLARDRAACCRRDQFSFHACLTCNSHRAVSGATRALRSTEMRRQTLVDSLAPIIE
jgi:hypothetical protein